MTTRLMLVSNPSDAFSQNVAAWLLKVSDLSNEFTVTDQAEEADQIIFVDSFTDSRYRFVRHHPLVARHPYKCYLFSQVDDPIHVLPGVYVNLDRRYHSPGWSDSFCYVDTYRRNPYLAEARKRCPGRSLLFSFLGRDSDPVRKKLLGCRFDRSDVIIEETAEYIHWRAKDERARQFQQRYADVSASSKFIVCPRGAGVSSIRLFEAMELGCVPVIVSDDWVPPTGPRWGNFSLRVREQDLNQLQAIIAEREADWESMAKNARQEWLRWFQETNFLKQIVHRTLALRSWDVRLRRRCEGSARHRLRWRWMRQTEFDMRMQLKRAFQKA